MIEEQKIVLIDADLLLDTVKDHHSKGYRLVQIGCSKIEETLEINYSFDKNSQFVTFKVILPSQKAEIKSVSGIYWSAFLYENEMSDLYGVKVKDMAVDYQGNFYRTNVKTPFNSVLLKKEGE